MKVKQIVAVIDTYNLYKTKISNDKTRLFWEQISNGESDKTLQLRKQIKADEESLGKYLDEEV